MPLKDFLRLLSSSSSANRPAGQKWREKERASWDPSLFQKEEEDVSSQTAQPARRLDSFIHYGVAAAAALSYSESPARRNRSGISMDVESLLPLIVS